LQQLDELVAEHDLASVGIPSYPALIDSAIPESETVDAERNLAFVQAAPHETPVSRVDEVLAARHPVLRWTP